MMVRRDECEVENPGEITWTMGQPRQVIGTCPHECPHNMGTPMANGPDTHRYQLVRCDVPDGCNGDCRAWEDWAAREVSPWLHVGGVVDRDTGGGR